MKYFLSLIFIVNTLFSQVMQEKKWPDNLLFLNFLENHNIPVSVFYNLDASDQKLSEDIISGTKYYILKEENSTVVNQVLIPVGEELQIHLYKDKKGEYKITTTPSVYTTQKLNTVININTAPSINIYRQTGNEELVRAFIVAQKKKINLKSLRKNDQIAIRYTQKIKLGRAVDVKIHAIEVKFRKYKKYLISFKGKYYDARARSFDKGYYLVTPLRYKRISSKFTFKRWHPILKRYRAHLGVDYAAKTGTPIWATAGGKVISKRWRGGYGRCIEIRHENGYKSLYAHMSRYAKIKVGQRVKKRQVIGYVGTSGRSTGPHLHFGLYRWNKPINPQKAIKIVKNMNSKMKKEFNHYLKRVKYLFSQTRKHNTINNKIEDFKLSMPI